MKFHGASLAADVEQPVHGDVATLAPECSANAFRGSLEATGSRVFVEARSDRFVRDALASEARIELLAHEALHHERSPSVPHEDVALQAAAPCFAEEELMVDELVGDGLSFGASPRAGGVNSSLNLRDGDLNITNAGIDGIRLRESRRRLEEHQE